MTFGFEVRLLDGLIERVVIGLLLVEDLLDKRTNRLRGMRAKRESCQYKDSIN